MKIKRVLVTGANGAVASDLIPTLLSNGYSVLATDIDCPSDSPFKIKYMDIRDKKQILSTFKKFDPDCVIHLAAEVDVEYCELNPRHAIETNTLGTKNIALACKTHDSLMIYSSSVGVFDGKKKGFYKETDKPRPVNVYGLSKYKGEKYVQKFLKRYFIVRFGWMIGGYDKDKKFVAKILKMLRRGVNELKVVKDKKGTPTYTVDLAEVVTRLIKSDKYGIYHISSLGSATRFDIAKFMLKFIKRTDVNLKAVLTKQVNKIFFAPRPNNESVDATKVNTMFPGVLRKWEKALEDYLSSIGGVGLGDTENPLVSIVICLYIANDRFFNDLKKFKSLKYKNIELIIVSDKKIDIPKLNFPSRLVLTGKKRTGVGEKRDFALNAAKGDFIAYIDDDAYPHPDWISNALVSFKAPTIGAVGGPNITPKEDSFWAKIGGFIYESYLTSGGAQHRFLPKAKKFVTELQGVNLIIRKPVLKKVGGFSTKLFSGDDTKVCYSIGVLGYDILYDPKVQVYHHRREFPFNHLKQIRTMATHRGYFVKKYPETSLYPIYFLPSVFMLGLILLALAGVFIKSALFVVIGIATAFILAGMYSVQKRSGIFRGLLVGLGILLTHLTYGFFFLRGLVFVKKL